MSDYEMLNQRIAAQKVARREEVLKRLVCLLALALAVMVFVVGLNHIGFISDLFMAILLSITVCAGSFNAGIIWTGFKR